MDIERAVSKLEQPEELQEVNTVQILSLLIRVQKELALFFDGFKFSVLIAISDKE